MKEEILEQIGLSRNEIKVYFALLELDQSTATPIVRRSNIPNSKIYPTLDKLIKKGLVSYVIKNNVKYFQASSPENLMDILNDKEKKIVKQKEEINKLVKEIELKKKLLKDRQEAVVYENLSGIKAAFKDILNTLKSNEEYYVFTLGEELEKDELKRFFKKYHKDRIKKNINVKLIVNKEIKTIFSKYHMYKNMKVRYTNLTLPTGIFIYGNKVMTVVWKNNPTAFIITSKNNSEKYKGFFETMWKIAKK